ncbi:MAG: MFS transporter, partial [Kiritimatiellales bacterium]|nr:MFS transporter [Kiritimatiellales bacterium]
MKNKTPKEKVSLARIFGYALGEGATSITMNGISNFAMLFYTQVLGLGAAYAGIALSVTMLWDAVTDPVMGHISDNTRSRFGRRLPYVLWGGLALAISFFALWVAPGRFSSPTAIFWCVLVVNLIVRTAVTIFVVPYTALGFEICPDYVDRSRLQGVRYFLNQVTNLVFGAFAWTLFFKDGVAADGSRVDGTVIQGNYLTMGAVLACASFIMIIFCILSTRRYATDSRDLPMEGNNLRAFFHDIGAIFKDRVAWYVFGFFGIAQLAMLLTSQIQMFTYVNYMQFTEHEKTFVHGTGMVAFALGALFLSRLVRRFDKKAAGYIGIAISMAGSLSLFALFSCGIIEPRQTLVVAGSTIPLATILFATGQGMWWGGCGVLVPLATSMIADISAINQHRSGLLKDGSYSAVFSFFLKAACSFGLLITGWLVSGAGIVSGAEVQTA